jgi:hypothetical protein
MVERLLIGLLADGHVLLEGVPGLAKTSRSRARPGDRRRVPPHPVHARPAAGRPRRHAGLQPAHGDFTSRAGADLRQHRARRRDQPRPGQGAVGAARGDAGAAGHDRRRHAGPSHALPRPRDAEPHRAGGHLPAARGAGRPLHAQARRRLPDARGGARDRRAHGESERDAEGAAGQLARADPAARARRWMRSSSTRRCCTTSWTSCSRRESPGASGSTS